MEKNYDGMTGKIDVSDPDIPNLNTSPIKLGQSYSKEFVFSEGLYDGYLYFTNSMDSTVNLFRQSSINSVINSDTFLNSSQYWVHNDSFPQPYRDPFPQDNSQLMALDRFPSFPSFSPPLSEKNSFNNEIPNPNPAIYYLINNQICIPFLPDALLPHIYSQLCTVQIPSNVLPEQPNKKRAINPETPLNIFNFDSSYFMLKSANNTNINTNNNSNNNNLQYTLYVNKNRSRNKAPRSRQLPDDITIRFADLPFKQETPFRCIECGIYFVKYDLLYKHYNELHLSDIPEPAKGTDIVCTQCTKPMKFFNVSSYKRHFKRVHSVNRFPCPNVNCNRIYSIPLDLKEHCRVCGLVLMCPHCGEEYNNARSFYSHKESKCCRGNETNTIITNTVVSKPSNDNKVSNKNNSDTDIITNTDGLSRTIHDVDSNSSQPGMI